MADDIIDIEDYEVKDKEIVAASDEEDYQGQYNQREYDQGEYDSQGGFSGYYRSISLDNTSLLIILMVAIVLIAIFVMTFD